MRDSDVTEVAAFIRNKAEELKNYPRTNEGWPSTLLHNTANEIFLHFSDRRLHSLELSDIEARAQGRQLPWTCPRCRRQHPAEQYHCICGMVAPHPGPNDIVLCNEIRLLQADIEKLKAELEKKPKRSNKATK